MSEAPSDQESVDEARARRKARSEEKDQAVRDSLEPLAPGERPLAVTLASVMAVFMAVVNVAAIAIVDRPAGVDQGEALVQTFLISGILMVSAIGMWRAKYWAVLGFQTILALEVILLLLFLTRATNLLSVLLFLTIIGVSSAMFWFLIRAMARIQMPEAPDFKSLQEQRAEAEKAASSEESERADG